MISCFGKCEEKSSYFLRRNVLPSCAGAVAACWLFQEMEATPTDVYKRQQLRDYYDRQLDPERKPSASDIRALNEIQAAKEVFDKQISKRFQSAMDELAKFGYPGKYNPGIVIEAKTRCV